MHDLKDPKPCPCCNKDMACVYKDSNIFNGQDYGNRYPKKVALQNHGFQVRCENCGMQTCWWHYETEAIDSWNKRECDCLDDVLEALKKAHFALGCATLLDKSDICQEAYDKVDAVIDKMKKEDEE